MQRLIWLTRERRFSHYSEKLQIVGIRIFLLQVFVFYAQKTFSRKQKLKGIGSNFFVSFVFAPSPANIAIESLVLFCHIVQHFPLLASI